MYTVFAVSFCIIALLSPSANGLQVEPLDSCVGVDHPPFERNYSGDGKSYLNVGLTLPLTFADDKFTKSAQRVGSGSIATEQSDHFNARYEGLGDRVEVEFYGPPGTRYYAALLIDGTYCTLILP